MILSKFLNLFRKKKKIKNDKKQKSKKQGVLKTFEPWNQLPPELKLECINRMDIFTKITLWGVSRTEQALLIASPIKIKGLEIESESYDNENSHSEFRIILSDRESYIFSSNMTKNNTFNDRVARLISFFLNYATVESIKMNSNPFAPDNTVDVMSKLKLKRQCQIKNVSISGSVHNRALPFLKMCSSDSISSVNVWVDDRTENFLDELFQLPSLNSTKTWTLDNLYTSWEQASWQIAPYLLKANRGIGTIVDIYTDEDTRARMFYKKEVLMQSEDFSEKVVLETSPCSGYRLIVVGSDTVLDEIQMD